MIFSNISFNVLYVDASLAVPGDGSTPETALAALPGSADDISDATCYLIRRTSAAEVTLPVGSNAAIISLLIMGMPKPADDFYSLVPAAARVAWGADQADYANVKAETGSDFWSGYEFPVSLELPAAKLFVLHRVHLYRDGINAYFAAIRCLSSDMTASIGIENCKFGLKGADIDSSGYTSSPANGSAMFVEADTPLVFSIRHCVINCINAMTDYFEAASWGFLLKNAAFITVHDIDCYTTTMDFGMNASPALFLNSGGGGSTGNYENIRFHILQNGNSGSLPPLFHAGSNDYACLRNLSVDILTRTLGSANPSSRVVDSPLVRCLGAREFCFDTIVITLPGCWRVHPSCHVLALSGHANSNVPGSSRTVRNITVTMAETGGLDAENPAGNYYDEIKEVSYEAAYYGQHAAVWLDFTGQYASGAWEPVTVRNITVTHPRGIALHLAGSQLRTCILKGQFRCRRVTADITSMATWYPGAALCAIEASTVKIGTLTLGKGNLPLFDNDHAIWNDIHDQYSYVYVEASNGRLMTDARNTSTERSNGYAAICANEIDTGHYTMRTNNGLCDTWSVHRTGGSPATLKLSCNTADGIGFMSLGRQPFGGFQVTPDAIGKKTLRIHGAARNLTGLDELSRRVLVQVAVPRNGGGCDMALSSVCGRWAEDVSGSWTGEVGLNAFILDLPLTVSMTDTPIDVKVHYKWYSGAGYFYLDPAIELIAEA